MPGLSIACKLLIFNFLQLISDGVVWWPHLHGFLVVLLEVLYLQLQAIVYFVLVVLEFAGRCFLLEMIFLILSGWRGWIALLLQLGKGFSRLCHSQQTEDRNKWGST